MVCVLDDVSMAVLSGVYAAMIHEVRGKRASIKIL
jgi:hypothetical protein